MCAPYDPIDFQKREWVPSSGWPITRDHLDPYYTKAHDTLKLGPYQYELKDWQVEIPDLIPFPLDDKVVWTKVWQFIEARFNALYAEDIKKAKNVHLYTSANVTDIITEALQY